MRAAGGIAPEQTHDGVNPMRLLLGLTRDVAQAASFINHPKATDCYIHILLYAYMYIYCYMYRLLCALRPGQSRIDRARKTEVNRGVGA